MNKNLDPCDDFYDFACGRLLDDRNHESFLKLDVFGTMNTKNQLYLKDMMDLPQDKLTSSQYKAKLYYNSCLDEDLPNITIRQKMTTAQMQYFSTIVKSIGNDWYDHHISLFDTLLEPKNGIPENDVKVIVMDKIRDKRFNNYRSINDKFKFERRHRSDKLPQKVLSVDNIAYFNSLRQKPIDIAFEFEILAREYGLDAFFLLSIGQDSTNSSTNIIIISQGGTPLPPGLYKKSSQIDKKLLDNYLNSMILISMFLFDMKASEARQKMERILNFETDLAEIMIPDVDIIYTNDYDKRLKLKDMNQIVEMINWPTFVNSMFTISGVKIDGNETIMISPQIYFQNLNKLLNRYLSTEDGKKILHDYLIWQLVYSLLPYLPRLIFEKIITPNAPRWASCLSETNRFFGFPLGSLYIKEHFNNITKGEVNYIE
ncbi:endothelin-converting enzyme homolog [Gordionus sp. m RMFG-2023]|uniref:endothelin-converting enzyme homolog n=1 Tax=Gordionus sp. m RMFG-2023 TaxID=3053472 RepID=UPI0031FD7338